MNETKHFEPLLDAAQAAALLQCHPRTLLRKAREGAVPSLNIFGKVRFTVSALAQWVSAQGYTQGTSHAA